MIAELLSKRIDDMVLLAVALLWKQRLGSLTLLLKMPISLSDSKLFAQYFDFYYSFLNSHFLSKFWNSPICTWIFHFSKLILIFKGHQYSLTQIRFESC